MMMGLLACVAALGAPMDRAAFVGALRSVEEGWTSQQVEQVLGRPDEVLPGNEVWCYGTDEPHSFPTLGRVIFREGVVFYTVGSWGEPPSPRVIDEKTLRAAIRAIDPPRGKDGEPLNGIEHTIRVSNYLVALGEEKAKASLKEYGRLSDISGEEWLFCLVRFAFTSKAPGGVISGGITTMPFAPGDRTLWPTHPVITVKDVPFRLQGLELVRSGQPTTFFEAFSMYGYDRDLVMNRKRPFVPPNDPFPLVAEVLKTTAWKSMFYESKGPEVVEEERALHPVVRVNLKQIPFEESWLRVQVLELLHAVYRPDHQPSNSWPTASEFQKCHREFLKLRCHWDKKRQCYVRGDGSVLPN
jgi:hypothetical protein